MGWPFDVIPDDVLGRFCAMSADPETTRAKFAAKLPDVGGTGSKIWISAAAGLFPRRLVLGGNCLRRRMPLLLSCRSHPLDGSGRSTVTSPRRVVAAAGETACAAQAPNNAAAQMAP
jgi:hypothetical protein